MDKNNLRSFAKMNLKHEDLKTKKRVLFDWTRSFVWD